MTEKVHIELRQNGPAIITGPFTLDNGEEVEAGEKMALCRCGESAKKPRCDGAHKAAGFKASGVEPPRKPD